MHSWRPIFACEPLSTLLFRQTRFSSPAYHDLQSTIPLGKLIRTYDGPENLSWVRVLMHRKKNTMHVPLAPYFRL